MIFEERFKERTPPDPRPDGAIPFLVDTGGAGDLINAVGFARGYRSMGIDSWIVTRRNDYKDLLSVLLEEPKDDDEGGICTGGVAYYYEGVVKESGGPGFINYLRTRLPHNPPWSPPDVGPRPEDREWALKCFADSGGDGKKILLSPYAAWHARNWPLSYWSDLAWALKHEGHQVLSILPKKEVGPEGEEPQKVLTASLWGHPWSHSAALCSVADLVIGNDSGTAHLAGACRVPTIAVCGPTTGMFDQFPSVQEVSLSRRELSCVGCWFDGTKGHRSACDRYCEALLRTPAGSVLSIAKRTLQAGIQPPGDWKPSCVLPHLKRRCASVPLTIRTKPHVETAV